MLWIAITTDGFQPLQNTYNFDEAMELLPYHVRAIAKSGRSLIRVEAWVEGRDGMKVDRAQTNAINQALGLTVARQEA